MFKRFNFKSRRILHQQILTCFFLFAIPLALFSYGIHYFSLDILTNQYLENIEAAATGVAIRVEDVTNNASTNAAILRNNKYCSNVIIDKMPGAFVYIQDEISTLTMLSAYFNKIAFYNSTSDNVYSSSIYPREYYFNNIFQSVQLNANTEFSKIYQGIWMPMQFTTSTIHQSDVIASYILPVEQCTIDGTFQTASVLISHLSFKEIQELLTPLTSISDTHAIVLYKGKPIFSDDVQLWSSFTNAEHSALSSKAKKDTATVGGEEYRLHHIVCDENISILAILPLSNIEGFALSISRTYLLALAISAGIGLILFFFGLWRTYSPISKLQKTVTNMIPNESLASATSLNEIDQTTHAIETLLKTHDALRDTERNLKLSHILYRLLENSAFYSTQPTFHARCAELSLAFDATQYCCVFFSKCPNRETLFMALDEIQQEVSFPGKIFSVGDIDSKNAIALFCYDRYESCITSDILNRLSAQYECASIGNLVASISEISVSYKQAYHALIGKKDDSKILYYQPSVTMKETDIIAQFSRESDLFSAAIAHSERSKVMLSLSNISNLLSLVSNNGSIQMFLQHLLFLATKTLQCNSISPHSTLELFGNISFSADSPLTSYRDWLKNFGLHLNSLLKQTESETASYHAAPIKDIQYALLYINTHYNKPDFSAQQLADEMHLTLSNLSYFFKSRTGKNISEYTNELRVKEAKRLLEESDLKIAEIVPLLGYYHTSSFTKSFKQATGQTPSEYKNAHRKA